MSFSWFQNLEKILPAKPKFILPTGDNVDEVSMVDYENTRGSSKSKSKPGMSNFHEMMEEDGDDDDEDGAGGQRVDCKTH